MHKFLLHLSLSFAIFFSSFPLLRLDYSKINVARENFYFKYGSWLLFWNFFFLKICLKQSIWPTTTITTIITKKKAHSNYLLALKHNNKTSFAYIFPVWPYWLFVFHWNFPWKKSFFEKFFFHFYF